MPYPYNLDLSGVLRRLDRKTPTGRIRLANDPVTAAYLSAGMQLIEKNLGPGAERRTPSGTEGAGGSVSPLPSFLSQRVVAAEVANNPPPFHRMGSIGTLRTTWRSQSDYIADLLRFGLWAHQFPIVKHSEKIEAAKQRLITGGDFVEEFHALCYWLLVTLLATPAFRLGLLAAAVAEADETVARAVSDHYQDNRDKWNSLYMAVVAAYQVSLRPGTVPEDMGRPRPTSLTARNSRTSTHPLLRTTGRRAPQPDHRRRGTRHIHAQVADMTRRALDTTPPRGTSSTAVRCRKAR